LAGGAGNGGPGGNVTLSGGAGSPNGAVIVASGNLGISSSTPSNLLVVGSGVGALDVTSGGNVGIGTAAPGYQLDVNGGVGIEGNNVLHFSNTAGISSTNGSTLIFSANSGASLMYLDGGGNLGIGTASPASTLQISQSAPGALGPILFLQNSGSGPGGSVRLSFGGDAGATPTTGSGYIITQEDPGAYTASMQFGTYGTGNPSGGLLERMRITSSGNVGISTAPASITHTLEVGGTINAQAVSMGYQLVTNNCGANSGGCSAVCPGSKQALGGACACTDTYQTFSEIMTTTSFQCFFSNPCTTQAQVVCANIQ
jgi:hypothetical protein